MPDHWEHGSEFHWPRLSGIAGTRPSKGWETCGRFFGSGRDALRALLVHGQSYRGWTRLWVPSYFCQDVVSSIVSTGICAGIYDDLPELAVPALDRIPWRRGDAVLVVNYFGLRQGLSIKEKMPIGIELIEDHTHDPWSRWARESRADWGFSSLRKTLPLGCGGVLWSPAGHSVPSEASVSAERHVAALEKLAAMMLKKQYLKGFPAEKEVFLRLQDSGEKNIARGKVSGMPEWAKVLMPMFPVESWRKKRFQNYLKIRRALKDVQWLEVLRPQTNGDGCPFACILKFDTRERRDLVLKRLAGKCVYAAVLWPLEESRLPGVRAEDRDFSRRMLAVHCDMRYSGSDMDRVASLIRRAGANLSE